jgi:type IV secretion system protein VirB8
MKIFSKMSSTLKKQEQLKNRLPQSFIEAAADFEREKIIEIKRSRKIAWIIAGISIAICSISILAFLVALLMRTEPEPTIIKVDTSTGASEVLRSVRDSQDRYDDIINKYWLAQYLYNCEGYDWYLISQQFENCKFMSAPIVAADFSSKVQDPNSPLKVIQDRGKVIVKIVSITFLNTAAQVRFTTEGVGTGGEPINGFPLRKWIATISFEFKPGLMSEQQRLINPLGFKVLAYRLDPEAMK